MKPWTLLLFRVLVTVEALLGLLQAVLAGGFLSGDYGALNLHAINAVVTSWVGTTTLVSAILLWRPGRGPGWPALAYGGIVLAEGLQMALGYGRVLAIHVPLGVCLITVLFMLVLWAWSPQRTATAPDAVEQRAKDLV